MSPTEGPLVSLVMPVFRPNEAWLRASVASALAQRGCRLELIAVDDGSPEPVAELLADVEDPRLRVLRVEHQGQFAARNAGVAAASGDFIRFVDCDDLVEPSSSAHLLELAGREGKLIAYGATQWCDESLRPLWTLTCRLQGEVVHECLLGRFSVRHPSLLFPRRVVEAAGPWDSSFRSCGDWDFVLRALEHADVRGDETVVLRYRKHAGSASADRQAVEEGMRRVIDGFLGRHPEQRGSALAREAYANVAAVAAGLHRGELRAYSRRLVRLARLDPGRAASEALRGLPALGQRLAKPVQRARMKRPREKLPSTSTRRSA